MFQKILGLNNNIVWYTAMHAMNQRGGSIIPAMYVWCTINLNSRSRRRSGGLLYVRLA